jgi:5-methylcytosine-specific restriction endonuclease McrA
MAHPRSFLVLWQTAEADSCLGIIPSASVGTHMKGLVPGDRIFVTACDGSELYLLGAMKVTTLGVQKGGRFDGKPRATGKTLAGPFQMVSLGGLKWRLRFENTTATKLSTSKSLLWQVRSRRRLTTAAAELLLNTLASERRAKVQMDQRFAKEGHLVMQAGTKRERDPKVRSAALKAHDFTCVVCGLKPADVYGSFAKRCLDVHHLKPLASGGKRFATTLRDVILVCSTCHRVLHTSGEPTAWKQLRRDSQF